MTNDVSSHSSPRSELYVYLFFIVIFFFQLLIVSPRGNFPLNDDWAHTLTIYHYVNSGELLYPQWLSTFSYIPILYGIFISEIGHFSFSLLRLTNLFFGFGCVLLLYSWLRFRGLTRSVAVGAGIVLWAYPIFFNLSYTFMGDIPALFFVILSFFLFDRSFERNSAREYWLGALAAMGGFFIRQIPILLIPAVVLHGLATKRFTVRQAAVRFFAPALVVAVIVLVLSQLQLLPGHVTARLLPEGWSYMQRMLNNAWQFLLLISLCVAPFTISALMKNGSWLKQRLLWMLVVSAGISVYIAELNGSGFPALGNIITTYGLGPVSVLQGMISHWGNLYLYAALHIVLAFNAGLLMFIVIRNRSILSLHRYGSAIFYLILYMLLILPTQSFDRYVLLILPVAILCIASLVNEMQWSRLFFVLTVTCVLFWSMVGTYNYLMWNQARWKLGERLVAKGVPTAALEGGYEWNGWYLYARTVARPLGNYTPVWAPWYVQELFPGHPMTYILAFSPLGGYEVIDKEPTHGFFTNVPYIYANEIRPGSLR